MQTGLTLMVMAVLIFSMSLFAVYKSFAALKKCQAATDDMNFAFNHLKNKVEIETEHVKALEELLDKVLNHDQKIIEENGDTQRAMVKLQAQVEVVLNEIRGKYYIDDLDNGGNDSAD